MIVELSLVHGVYHSLDPSSINDWIELDNPTELEILQLVDKEQPLDWYLNLPDDDYHTKSLDNLKLRYQELTHE